MNGMALKTLSRVLALTWPVPFRTRDTVAFETPARRATSSMVFMAVYPYSVDRSEFAYYHKAEKARRGRRRTEAFRACDGGRLGAAIALITRRDYMVGQNFTDGCTSCSYLAISD